MVADQSLFVVPSLSTLTRLLRQEQTLGQGGGCEQALGQSGHPGLVSCSEMYSVGAQTRVAVVQKAVLFPSALVALCCALPCVP